MPNHAIRQPPATALAAGTAGACLWGAEPASAHALNSAADVPIPSWLFVWAALTALLISFIALELAWRSPLLSRDRWRALTGAFSEATMSRARLGAGLLGVALLALTLVSGFWGTDLPGRNFAVAFVFVTFWCGLAFLSALIGDAFRPLNPWAAIARLLSGRDSSRLRPRLRYPERAGVWPAVAGIVAFGWVELVLGPTSTGGIVSPDSLALFALCYSAFTICGMLLFGVDVWLRRAEVFSVYFRMFSRLSPLEMRDRRIGWRGPLGGLTGSAAAPGSVALVLASIGVTTYDGAGEGVLAGPTGDGAEALIDAGLSATLADRLAMTLFFGLTLAAVAACFWIGIRGMRTALRRLPIAELAREFGPGLVPIALGYLVAHYCSYFLIQIQAQFTFLLVDPLGKGWNPLGLAGHDISYGPPSEVIWGIQVFAIVVGHIAGLAYGHDRALALAPDRATAARSQYWMLAVMMIFTSLALYLLSYSNQ